MLKQSNEATDDRARPPTESAELPSTRQIARKLAIVAIPLAIAAVVVTQLPGLKEIPHQLAGADGGWISAALILELASTASFAARLPRRLRPAPQPARKHEHVDGRAGHEHRAASGGAGGLAVGAVLLDRAGVPRSFAASRTVALFLITSLVSFVAVVIAGFGVAAGALSGDATLAVTLLPGVAALLLIVVVFALPRSQGSVSDASRGG